jgi:hypothetical protein
VLGRDGVVGRARVMVRVGDLGWFRGWSSGLVLEVHWTGVGLALGWYCLVNAWEEVCE